MKPRKDPGLVVATQCDVIRHHGAAKQVEVSVRPRGRDGELCATIALQTLQLVYVARLSCIVEPERVEEVVGQGWDDLWRLRHKIVYSAVLWQSCEGGRGGHDVDGVTTAQSAFED